MNKFGKKVVAAALCMGLSMTALTGCASVDKNAVVATMDGTEIKMAEVNFWLRYQQANMEMYLGGLFGEASMWTQDLTGTGVPYGVTLKEDVLDQYKEMLLCEQHMADYQVELTEDEKKAISDAAAQFVADNSEKTLKAMTADEETVNRVLTLYTIQYKVRTAVQAGADTEVSDEEAAQKTIEYTYFSTADTTDEEGNTVARTEEEIEEIKAQAQGVIDAVKGGKTMEEAAKEVSETQNVTTYSYGTDETTLNEAVKTAADALADGEVTETPVEGESGVYVIQMKSTFDEEATQERKTEIVNERKSQLYQETLEGWEPESFEVNSKVWDKVAFDVKFEAPEPETEAAQSEEVSEDISEAETTEAASEAQTTEAAEEETTEAVSEAETTEAASEAQTTEAVSE